MKKKVCTKCGEEHNIENFHRTKYNKSGRMPKCKFCMAIYRQKKREEKMQEDENLADPFGPGNSQLRERASAGCLNRGECLAYYAKTNAKKLPCDADDRLKDLVMDSRLNKA